MKVEQTGHGEWRVKNAQAGDVLQAAEDAVSRTAPLDHLPLPMALPLKMMVSAVTNVTKSSNSVGRTHLLGPGLYDTQFVAEQDGQDVKLKRKTRGILGAGAELGDFGTAIEKAARRRGR